MSFGSFLRGIAAQVNPFDNGATYGTYNPPQKKRQDDQNQFGSSQPAPRPVAPTQNNQPTNQPQVQKPQNLFQSLNSDLRLPNSPQNNANPSQSPVAMVHAKIDQGLNAGKSWEQIANENNLDLNTVRQYSMATRPNYGAHVIPQPAKPNIFQKVGNGLKTAGETVVGTASNLPEVGLAAARTATGIVGGATQLPSLATHALTYVPRKVFGNDSTVNRVLSDVNQGVDKATAVVNRPINYVNRGLDIAAKTYADKVPTAYGGAQVYRTTQIPLNVLAGLLTLGGSTAAEGAGETGNVSKLGQVTRFLNKPRTSNPDNLISRTGQVVTNRTTPVVQAVNTPFRTTTRAIGNTINNMRSLPTAERDLVDAGEAGNVIADAGQPTQIPVSGSPGTPVNIPVQTPATDNPFIHPLIRENSGDATTPGVMPDAQEVASRRFNNQPKSPSDQNIEGVTPGKAPAPFKIDDVQVKKVQDNVVNEYAKFLKDTGEGNGVDINRVTGTRVSNNYRPGMGKGRVTKQQWIDEARKQLESGNAESGHQQAFNDAANPDVQSLINKGDTSAEAPAGRPITVKDVKGIPVVDKSTNVPANLPETPGEVRVTTNAAPANTQAAAEAAKPTAAPVTVPPQTQAILDNPKRFTKQQVAAARNQLKLAKKLAKTQEATSEAMDRITSAKPTSDKGFVSTGEFRQGEQGNVTEVAHRATEAAQGAHDVANRSVDDVLQQAHQEVAEHGVMSPETTRNLKALTDSGRLSRTSPEFKAINNAYRDSISHHARALSLTDRTVRTTASGDQLANRFVSKLLAYTDNTGKLTDSHIKQVSDAENAFTQARDTANAAGEQFKATGSQEDFNAWKAAQQQAEQADRQAKITEYLVSKDVLKGNKNLDAAKAVRDAEKNAGVYSMDSIDANMLSGTGTMVRNYINTIFPRLENKLFGRASSLAVRKIAPIGGSSGRGARIGSQIGKDMFKADIQARKAGDVGFIRRTVTAGNTLGERNIQATAYSKAFSHYKQLLKSEGYKGSELNNRAEFNARTDPDGYVAQYQKDALQANALSSLTHTKKIENVLADGVQKALAGAGFGSKGQAVGRFGAKAVTRVGLGFPTVIARSFVEGLKRLTLGIPEAGWSTAKFIKTGDREAFAGELSKALQHAGTGGSLLLFGHVLGKMGVISGAYPSDPNERARWTAEGRQPNSINLGGQWFQIPGYLGGFALPLMIGAGTADGNIKDQASLSNLWQTALASTPVDNIQSTLDILTGKSTDAKTKNAVTSLARAVTPAGSFLAELAKLTDNTQNDTTTKDTLHNILDSIAAGIPGLNNKVNTVDKTDSYGNVLHNPNKVATVFGAQGSEQKAGTDSVQKEQSASDNTFNELKGYGVLNDSNLKQLIDPKLAKQIDSGQPLTPQDVKKVQDSVTKGISASEDNSWRQKGDYATDKAAMQVKLQMLNADPTSKPSEIKDLQTQIKRDDVLQNNNISYDDFKLYQSTSLSDWRSMGNDQSENYDPDTYQKLWTLDQLFQKAGASYNSKDPTKQKFSAKQPGSGSGGSRRASPVTGDFGKLSSGSAPTVKQYQTISSQTSGVPVIARTRPNIVHNISSSG